MNPRFQTQYTGVQFKGEVYTLPSETRPSKTLSLREIIDRDLSGMLSPAAEVQPYYNEAITVPDFKRMDLVDIDNWKAEMELQRKEILEDIKNERTERKRQLDAKKASEKAKRETLDANEEEVSASSGD